MSKKKGNEVGRPIGLMLMFENTADLIDAMESVLLMETIQDYVSRGRTLAYQDDIALEQLWLDSARRAFAERRYDNELGDIHAELALRNIKIKMPDDLVSQMAEALQIILSNKVLNSNLQIALMNDFDHFFKSLKTLNG